MDITRGLGSEEMPLFSQHTLNVFALLASCIISLANSSICCHAAKVYGIVNETLWTVELVDCTYDGRCLHLSLAILVAINRTVTNNKRGNC